MPSVAGPRVHWVSVTTIAVLAVFVGAVVALVAADILYLAETQATGGGVGVLRQVLGSPEIRHAMYLSAVTSGTSLVLVILFAVPIGYALSRYRFPGSIVLDAMVDVPIVLPPIVIGVSLLVFFRTSAGQAIQSVPGLEFVYTPKGIVLCQFFVSASYGIRAAKSAFDAVDLRLEHLALTLGCTHGQALRWVALPMARNGLAAGAVMAWARAVGVFGPLMIFAGTVRMKTEALPTTIYLELSIGRIEPALGVAMLMVAMAMVALTLIHAIGSRARWWGT